MGLQKIELVEMLNNLVKLDTAQKLDKISKEFIGAVYNHLEKNECSKAITYLKIITRDIIKIDNKRVFAWDQLLKLNANTFFVFRLEQLQLCDSH